MKFSFTDKFLWEIYNFLEKTVETFEPPEIFKIRSFERMLSSPQQIEFWKELKKRKSKRQFSQFINYLKKKGYIKSGNLKGKKGILLTSRGKEKALRIGVFIESAHGFKKRKDKKWIMVIFDVPEKKKQHREELRRILYALGFKKLQKSVWVSPYDVLERLEDAVRIYKLDYYIRTFIIEEIEL